MRKTNLKIFLCILFTSRKIAAQYRNESYAENVTEQDDDTSHFDDPDSPVSNHS